MKHDTVRIGESLIVDKEDEVYSPRMGFWMLTLSYDGVYRRTYVEYSEAHELFKWLRQYYCNPKAPLPF